jgi:hypothetical protein
MTLHFELNERVRELMLEEFELDLAADKIFKNPRVLPEFRDGYALLLRAAVESGSPESLAAAVNSHRILKKTETRNVRGSEITAKVPSNAAILLAEGEFKKYYMRAICRIAMDDGVSKVEIYRAKPVREERSESGGLVGSLVDAHLLLEDLRKEDANDEHRLLAPNSGLSVRLPE